MVKKAFFFSFDALIAISIMLAVLYAASLIYISNRSDVQQVYYAQDLVEIFSSVSMQEINNSQVAVILQQHNLTEYNLTVLEQIGRFWAVGDVQTARNLSEYLLGSLIPVQFGYALVAGNDVIFETDTPLRNQLSSAKQMVSGLESGHAIEGKSARLFLKDINAKQDAAYAYFGGYEGDGNLTKLLYLPADFFNIQSAYFEVNNGAAFDLYVNGNYSGTYNATNASLGANKWYLDSMYFSNFAPDQNLVELRFAKTSSNYIGGGYLKVEFSTSEIDTSQVIYENGLATQVFDLPGIDGVINLYTSLYIPGNLTSMQVQLHYYANHSDAFQSPFFLRIGNTTVFEDTNSTVVQLRTLTDAELSMLDYGQFSRHTVPVRLGFSNLSSQEIVIGGYQGDSVLITDVSGSMNECDIDKTGFSALTCPSDGSDPDAERLETAKFVDKDFIDRIVNISGNRVGLVSYSSVLEEYMNLSDNAIQLKNHIDSYVPLSATCISCGIYQATQVLIRDNTKPLHDDIWKYTNAYQFTAPPANWYDQSYNDSLWPSGKTVLGFGGVDTSINNALHPDLWDMAQDHPEPIDFSSGMNSTANSFGFSAAASIATPLLNMHFDGPSLLGWTSSGAVQASALIENATVLLLDDFESYYTSTTQINGNSINRSPGYWITNDAGQEVYIFANDPGYAAYSPTDVLVFRDMDSYGYIRRTFNLLGYARANLTYAWRLSGENDLGDYGDVRINDGSWQTLRQYAGNIDDDDQYHNASHDLSSYVMRDPFYVQFGAYSYSSFSQNGDLERFYVEDIRFTGVKDYFGMRDYWIVDSNGGSSGSLNQSFSVPDETITKVTFSFNHSVNAALFNGTANPYCSLKHPSGESTLWSASWTQASHPQNGPIQETFDITSYVTNTSYLYAIECGASVTSGSGRTIVAFDDLSILVNYTSTGNDGWDWARGNETYGSTGDDGAPGDHDMTAHYDPSAKSDGVTTDGSKRVQVDIGGVQCGTNCGYSDSGAFGIQLNITSAMYDSIQNGGKAIVSFRYAAFDRESFTGGSDDTEESVWIKARFGNQAQMHYLGYDLDTGQSAAPTAPADSPPEILYDYSVSDNVMWHQDNTRGDFDRDGDGVRNTGMFVQDVTQHITGPGWYYLDMGAKFDSSGGWQSTTEGIVAFFDDVDISIQNASGNFYFRKTFAIQDLNSISLPKLYVYSDDGADVYINGNLVSSDPGPHNATYWNVNGISVDTDDLISGDNVIAVKIYNDDAVSAKFDLELRANVSVIPKAMVIMSDGQANYCHGPNDGLMDINGWSGDCLDSQAVNETVSFACYAKQHYNISIYAVAFGAGADVATLNRTACCDDCSHFFMSTNVTGLQEAYKNIALNLLKTNVVKMNQTINISGQYIKSVLYPDSFIRYTYIPDVPQSSYGKIPITAESARFNNEVTTGTIDLPQGIEVSDFKVTSYSGNRWTDLLRIQNAFYQNWTAVYNLSVYNAQYEELGDPYIVQVPVSLLAIGSGNSVWVSTGTNATTSTNGSADDRAIYTVHIDALVNYTGVFPKAAGCRWSVDFEDNTSAVLRIPETYGGTKTCDYASGVFDPTDAIDNAAYQLLKKLDFDNDGKIIVNIDSADLETEIIGEQGIPFLWGPAIMEIRVWS
ncbi:VWA domain-containing protein [Candidatus Woesearchaeota archaeon]|nr:VWA domain-containing protein [Candidatus Woesearchaeota archaeon]